MGLGPRAEPVIGPRFARTRWRSAGMAMGFVQGAFAERTSALSSRPVYKKLINQIAHHLILNLIGTVRLICSPGSSRGGGGNGEARLASSSASLSSADEPELVTIRLATT